STTSPRNTAARPTVTERRSRPPSTPAACDLGVEGAESLIPERPEPVQPRVHLTQRRRVDRVDAPGSLGPNGREPVLPQDAQVLRHRGLADVELLPDDGGQRPGGQLVVGQQLEDPPPDRVADDVEGVHRFVLGYSAPA